MEYETLKVVIVDDEARARDVIRFLLGNIPFVQIEGEADSVSTALPLIIHARPDVVLLDIKMPGQDGFSLLDELIRLELHSHIIFITGDPDSAYKAIRYRPFDFLLKPVHPDELHYALRKVLIHNRDHHIITHDLKNRQEDFKRNLCFKTRSGFIMVDTSNILYVEADWNYSTIFLCNNKQELVTLNIGKIEKMLPLNGFFRINRSNIINLDFLLRVDRKRKFCIVNYDNNEKIFKAPRQKIRLLDALLNTNQEFF